MCFLTKLGMTSNFGLSGPNFCKTTLLIALFQIVVWEVYVHAHG